MVQPHMLHHDQPDRVCCYTRRNCQRIRTGGRRYRLGECIWLCGAIAFYLGTYCQETPNLKAFGNPYSPTDAANFLKLLKALRSALGTASVISAAVGRLPWIGEDGFASTDVSEFSEQLSFINVMYVFVRGLCTLILLRGN